MIIRVEKERDFSVMANRPLRDRRLSLGARGLLALLLTNEDGWEVDTEYLQSQSPDAKRDKILSLLKELENHGYYYRSREQGEGGRWEWISIIYEDPRMNPSFDPDSVQPYPVPLAAVSGFVYLIGCGEFYKIGATRNVTRRFSKIKNGTPFPCELLWHSHFADAYATEKELHARFAHAQTIGEWFKLAPAEVEFIRNLDGKADNPPMVGAEGQQKASKSSAPSPPFPDTDKAKMEGGNRVTEITAMVEQETVGLEAQPLGQSPATDKPTQAMPTQAKALIISKTELEEILTERRTITEEELITIARLAPPLSRAQQGKMAFLFWRLHLTHMQAVFNAKRQRAVDDRLKEGYRLSQIINAIRGCKLSPFHQGNNDRGRKYEDFELICRDGSKLEFFEGLAEADDLLEEKRAAEGRAGSQQPEGQGASGGEFSDEDINTFAVNYLSLEAQGYKVEHIKAKFHFGTTVKVADWTRILLRVEAIKTEQGEGPQPQTGDGMPAASSAEWQAAKERVSNNGAGVRAMPAAMPADYEKKGT